MGGRESWTTSSQWEQLSAMPHDQAPSMAAAELTPSASEEIANYLSREYSQIICHTNI
jgi:hypothetical protein